MLLSYTCLELRVTTAIPTQVASVPADAYASIIRFNSSHGNSMQDPKARVPGVWLCPRSLSLCVIVATDVNPLTGVPLMTPSSLSLGVWHMVRLLVVGNQAETTIDGMTQGRFTIGQRSIAEDVEIHIGDPFSMAADAEVADVVYRPLTSLPVAEEWLKLVKRGQRLRCMLPGAHNGQQDGSASSYLADIGRLHDEEVRDAWSLPRTVLPEYAEAAYLVCVEEDWMRSTVLLRQVDRVREAYASELRSLSSTPAFRSVLLAATARAYRPAHEEQASRQGDAVREQNIMQNIMGIYARLKEWQQPHFSLAMRVLAEKEPDAAAIAAKLAEVVDQSLHSRQVPGEAFSLLVSYAYRLLSTATTGTPLAGGNSGRGGDSSSRPCLEGYQDALTRVYEAFEDYMVGWTHCRCRS